MYAVNGILFNHESPIRGETFVSRKITRAVSRIALGLQEKLYIGNMEAKRDWGHAKDYIEAMWLMLQQEQPEDFVIATGNTTSVREFLIKAFLEVGIELGFLRERENEKAIVKTSNHPDYHLSVGKEVVAVDKRYFRPTEVDYLLGDATKAREKLDWKPTYDLDGLIKDMMQSDLELMHKDKSLEDIGHKAKNYFE